MNMMRTILLAMIMTCASAEMVFLANNCDTKFKWGLMNTDRNIIKCFSMDDLPIGDQETIDKGNYFRYKRVLLLQGEVVNSSNVHHIGALKDLIAEGEVVDVNNRCSSFNDTHMYTVSFGGEYINLCDK